NEIKIEGANAVVLGRSDIVGKPMALLLMHANATVTICHSKTRDLPDVVRRADIVVAAMGKAGFVQPDWIKAGAAVIDVGTNRLGAVIEMLPPGLTAGVASGQSAVAAMLRELGFAVLAADGLAHKRIDPGQPAYNKVVQEFGSSIVDPSGRVGRAKLGAIVFADQAKLDRLNAIVHPRVAEVVFS